MSSIIELNIGGVIYHTSHETLMRVPGTLFADRMSDLDSCSVGRDTKNRFFIDRDGILFRYVLDYLRNGRVLLPEGFQEIDRLKTEAEFFKIPSMVHSLDRLAISLSPRTSVTQQQGRMASPTRQPVCVPLQHRQSSPGLPTTTRGFADKRMSLQATSELNSGVSLLDSSFTPGSPGYITVSYRGSFAFGKEGLADVKFRKIARILVCGKVSLLREVFCDTLNEGRDPDRGPGDRYTQRFYLKHTFLEQAFDALGENGFAMVGSCSSGTNNYGETKPGVELEELRWQHYNEFIFCRG